MKTKLPENVVLYEMRIDEIKEETTGTKTFFFKTPENMKWHEGSDLHFAYPDFLEGEEVNKELVRHMSIMSLPDEGRIGFTTRVPGSASIFKRRLERLKPGDRMIVYKLSNKLPLLRDGHPTVLLSMGVGIATMRPIIHSFLQDKTGVPKLTSLMVDASEQPVYHKELNGIVDVDFNHIQATSRVDFFDRLDELCGERSNRYYLVGSDGFLSTVIAFLRDKGIEDQAILIDKKPEKREIFFP